ncbi:MAG: DNA primase DnaG [Halobacteriales archaeon]|nr:DNA primase DnaG [Halobacteriales archaeon]
MQASDTTKYFIHANLKADGVVERSDVVGAIYGQTEGLLGDDLDLRDLQQSDKISRMEVKVESENGSSYGTVTIGSSLDRVETSVLAASLETIERIGPCEAAVEIELVEDVRTTKRKEIVERAKYIHREMFDGTSMGTEEMLDEVRKGIRKGEITEYAGMPAGPNVRGSDAVLLVEGRADVLNLLKHGVKNAVGVEGTDVPDEIAELADEKTVTAFLDSDRGGDLILKELEQVADIDYVAHPPDGKCVEDLSGEEINEALRNKHPYGVEGDVIVDEENDGAETEEDADTDVESLRDSLRSVAGTDEALLLDGDRVEVTRVPSNEIDDELRERNGEVRSVVLGGEVTQSALDVASSQGVETVVGTEMGHVAKKPLDVNVVTEPELP